MAETVGVPAALGAELLLTDKYHFRRGVTRPTEPRDAETLLPLLAAKGIRFANSVRTL